MTAIASPLGRRIRSTYWSLAALVLLAPAIGMALTSEVAWGAGDFAVMGALLALLGLGIEMALRTSLDMRGRLYAIAAMVALFLLVWAELAVGLFD